MNENLSYCILGIVGGAVFSFLISWFFFYAGNHGKIIYVDIISNRKSTNSKNDIVCLVKNVGHLPLLMADFAPLNPPHFMAKEFTDSFTVIPPYKANFNNVLVRAEGEDAYVAFDYLNRRETIIIIFKDVKEFIGYTATMIGGTHLDYNRVINVIKNAMSITTFGLVLNITSLCVILNSRIGVLFAILGFILWYTIAAFILYFRVMKNHLKLLDYLKSAD